MQVTDHWVVACHPAWGHVRHMNGFIARSLRRLRFNDTLGITYMLHHTHAEKARLELIQLLKEEGESDVETIHLSTRVRFIGLKAPESLLQDKEFQARYAAAHTSSIRNGMEFDAAFAHQWDSPLSSILTCAATDQVFSYHNWPRPSVLHVDIYGGLNIKHVQKGIDIDIPRTVYHWSTEFVSFWRMFMHDEYSQGGIEDWATAKLGIDSGNEHHDICHQEYNRCDNQLLLIPGLHNGMYDYEIHPGQGGWPRSYVPALQQFKHAIALADAVVVASCKALQPECVDITAKFLHETHSTELYAIGPSIEDNLLEPVRLTSLSLYSNIDSKEQDLFDFMNRCLTQHGLNSVALLSWGTIWAPFKYPDLLEAWIDEVIESKRPFVLNRSAELFSKLSPWLEDKLSLAQSSGLAFQTTWIPQRKLLRHPALGSFISHCGYASACESPVPIVAWPSFFDQSIIAQQLQDHDLGWQLYQVRGPDAVHQKCRTLELRGERIIGDVETVRKEARRILQEAAPNSTVYRRKAENLAMQRARLCAEMQAGGETYERFNELIGCTR